MILQTEGVVLKSFNLRETSRIATFFTKDFGKVKGVLKGIRKDPKKFGSHVDRFSINDIVYYRHRQSELHLISQCDLKSFFLKIRQDYQKTLAATYAVELVDIIMPAEEANPSIYQLLMDFFSSLETTADINKLIHLFQIKILLYSGFRPHLDSCLICGRKQQGQARFSSQLGGLVCLVCPLQDTAARLVSQGTVASLLHIEQNPWAKSLRLGLATPIRKELKYLLNHFLVFHLGRHLKTTRYLP